ncbi:hypothetical protein ABZ897_34295 [Nonomuraea sp. NPDC046802]|uniref:hypothetical protein n=1 Tax=Nonomuraea sp. NPDC046802 TaxID=3154919 RepID=UPI00340CB99C
MTEPTGKQPGKQPAGNQPSKQLRAIEVPFVAPGPSGVAIRDRLKNLTPEDEEVLRAVGRHLGSLASADLKRRCADGLAHSSQTWAARKRDLTAQSSSRWAGSITKASHDQWALARRCQLAHIQSLEAGVRTLTHRLSLPIGEKGSKRAPGGYRSRHEWFAKSRRLAALTDRLERERADWRACVVHVVRGGKRLLNTRHHLDQARLTEREWRERWEAERWFLAADGESGKRYGNETIRLSPDGEVSIKLPAPLAHLANTTNGRYVLTARVVFAHRGEQWRDRVTANRAVAYRIHHDAQRGRWYLTASWQRPAVQAIPLESARAGGVIGVDTNADHFPPTGSTGTATRSVTRTASPMTCPAPPPIGTRNSGTPSPACCTGPNGPVWPPSPSRTWTSPPRRPARSTVAGSGSGSSFRASPPGSCAPAWWACVPRPGSA